MNFLPPSGNTLITMNGLSLNRSARRIALLLAVTAPGLTAQGRGGGILTGVVTDSADGRPIENAIVYIPNSTIGTTTSGGALNETYEIRIATPDGERTVEFIPS